MKLYAIRFNAEAPTAFVVAENVVSALEVWRTSAKDGWGNPLAEESEPKNISLLSNHVLLEEKTPSPSQPSQTKEME